MFLSTVAIFNSGMGYYMQIRPKFSQALKNTQRLHKVYATKPI